MSSEQAEVIVAKRYRINSTTGASVTGALSSASPVIHQLAHNTVVVCAEVRLDKQGNQRVRISSPAGWLAANTLAPADPVASLQLDRETFNQGHLKQTAGDHYGIAFPFTIEAIRDYGSDFLTTAFRAAGSIASDNSVKSIAMLEPCEGGAASEKALLTVEYAYAEPGLHTELFVKMSVADIERKFAIATMSHGEIQLARLSRERTLPVPVPRYYFGEYCTQTSNYLLITERVAFGVEPIKAVCHKGYDHHIADSHARYLALTTALARLVAAHKTGAVGNDLETVFPFPRAARNFSQLKDPEVNIDRLIDFISRVAPQLFPAETSQPDFLQRWRDDLLFGLTHKDAVIAYLHKNVDYTGLCHPNLNLDNAWYWHDASGALHVGLLDWGGVGQMSIAQALCGMLMFPDPEDYQQLLRDVIAQFVDEYARRSGLTLDADELHFQYKASVFSVAIHMIINVVVDMLFVFSEDDYKTMADRFDSRLQETGLCAGFIWINNMLTEWLEDVTPGDACRRILEP